MAAFQDFSAAIDSDFATDSGESLRLIEATALPGPPGASREAFSLVFRGRGAALEQKTHRLRHARLGDLDIFLVPIARDGAGRLYEAVFN